MSDFKNIEKKVTGETIQRVFTQPDLISQADFALEAGEKILKALEAQVDVKYEIPKMDQAAIPDFAAGAMENWGLVTYRYIFRLRLPVVL